MAIKPLSRLWWLYTPLAIIVAQIVLELSFDKTTLASLHSESGPHELLQTLFAGASCAMAVWLLTKVSWATQRVIGTTLLICALGTLYIAGEEVSWGQHIFEWGTPESWSALNDQNETNFHNTSAWLDQKPRLLLFIGIIMGGLLVPAMRRLRPAWLPPRFHFLYPSDIVIPTALGVLLPYLAQSLAEMAGLRLFERVSEVQELYMYYFILIYLMDFKNRIFSQV